MKLPINSAYVQALVAGQRQFIMADLYTFTSATGLVDYFTDFDIGILLNNIIYKAGGLRIQGLRLKIGVGVAVDEQEVTIWASPLDTLFGAAFLQGMADGLMDGGTIARDRAVWPLTTGNVQEDIGATPTSWRMFLGYMSTIEKLGRASVQFKVKSPLVKLNIDMPHNFYQPGCLWSLFDDSITTGLPGLGGVAAEGCTLFGPDYAVGGVVGGEPSFADPTATAIGVVGNVVNPLGADGLANYQRGRIVFSSGVNNGLMATINTNDDFSLFLAYPLIEVPSVGDTFFYYPGCSKAENTCQVKFNNLANFRAFDKVPPVLLSY